MNESLIMILAVVVFSIIIARIIVSKNLKSDKTREVLKHPQTGESRTTAEGFNWFAFLFTPIWCLVKGLYLQALLSLFFPFLVWIIAGFKGNQWYYDSLIEKGYLPEEQVVQEKTDTDQEKIDNLFQIKTLHELKESGAITEEEFEEKKKELL